MSGYYDNENKMHGRNFSTKSCLVTEYNLIIYVKLRERLKAIFIIASYLKRGTLWKGKTIKNKNDLEKLNIVKKGCEKSPIAA